MPYSEISTLTTNNSISEMMLKVNEIVYELNVYAPTTSNTISEHTANNYAHGVVIENILFDANTGVLDINYNDLSSANINLQLGTQDDVFFKTVTANNFYGGTFSSGTWNGNVVSEIYGGTNQSSYTTGDILYAYGTNTLTKLPIGATDQLLQVSSNGTIHWISTLDAGEY